MMLRITLEIIKDYHYLGNKYYKLYLSLSSIISCNYVRNLVKSQYLTSRSDMLSRKGRNIHLTSYKQTLHESQPLIILQLSGSTTTSDAIKYVFYYYYDYSIFLKISTISHDVGLDSGSKDIMWAMWGLMRWSGSLCVAGSACIIYYFGTLGPPPQSLTTWGPKTLPSKKPP